MHPVDAWRRLRENEGPRATVIDLYELVAGPRGLEPHELPLTERAALARSVLPLVWPGFVQTDGSERDGDLIQIVDIQISVDDLAEESRYVPPLESAGLQLRSRDDLHRYFRPFPDQPRDVHAHVCAVGSAWERDHVLFRDYLRTHPQARDSYAAAKCRAAAVWLDDGIAYTDAKSAAIRTILDAAERW
jgi:hypothetical protein